MTYDIYINDNIGWPISAGYVREKLSRFKGRPCTVYINSFGGSVPDALDIYQQFIDHGQITAVIFGMTASAATVLACGAKRILMSDSALLLIHRTSNWADEWGRMNAEEISAAIKRLSKSKDTLEKLDGIIANIYARRSGGSADNFASTMEEELWLTAGQAKELGLIDEIIEEREAPAGNILRNERFMAMAMPVPDDADSEKSGVSDENDNPLGAAFMRGIRWCVAALCGNDSQENSENTNQQIWEKQLKTNSWLCVLFCSFRAFPKTKTVP